MQDNVSNVQRCQEKLQKSVRFTPHENAGLKNRGCIHWISQDTHSYPTLLGPLETWESAHMCSREQWHGQCLSRTEQLITISQTAADV